MKRIPLDTCNPPVIASQSGGALLEAMLAVLIFSLGILALISFQAIAIKQSGEARYRADAAFIANSFESDLWGMEASDMAACNDNPECVDSWATRIAVLPNSRMTVTVSDTTKVKFEIFWKLPGDQDEHKYVHHAQIIRN